MKLVKNCNWRTVNHCIDKWSILEISQLSDEIRDVVLEASVRVKAWVDYANNFVEHEKDMCNFYIFVRKFLVISNKCSNVVLGYVM